MQHCESLQLPSHWYVPYYSTKERALVMLRKLIIIARAAIHKNLAYLARQITECVIKIHYLMSCPTLSIGTHWISELVG